MTYNTHQAHAQMTPHGTNPGPYAPQGGTYAPHAQAPRQGSMANVAIWGVLAAIALLVCGVFASEASKHTGDVDRSTAKMEEIQRRLKTFPFDANGNVAPADRMDFEMLMDQSKMIPSHLRAMRDIRDQELMITVAALVFAGGAGFLAWRNRPRAAKA